MTAPARLAAGTIATAVSLCGFAGCDDRNYNAGIFDAPAGGIAGADDPAATGSAPASSAGSASTASTSTASTSSAPSAAGANQRTSGGAPGAGANGGASAGASPSLSAAPRTLDIPTPVPGDGSKPVGVAGAPLVEKGEVVVAPGEEPYQKLARDRKFDEFRRRSAPFVELSADMLPLGEKLADGSATAEERAEYFRLEKRADQLFKPLNAYMWNERWTEADRAAMGWILYGGVQTRR